jgi:hypothetical protein
LAKQAMAFVRSTALIFPSRGESNTILSWCGARDRAGVVEIGFGELRILLLQGDSGIALGASPETTIDEEIAQIAQRSDIDVRRACLHAGAGGRIQHPGCQHDDHARRGFNMCNPTARTQLAVMLTNAAAVKRMPMVVDLDFLSDMGRMNGRSRNAENSP